MCVHTRFRRSAQQPPARHRRPDARDGPRCGWQAADLQGTGLGSARMLATFQAPMRRPCSSDVSSSCPASSSRIPIPPVFLRLGAQHNPCDRHGVRVDRFLASASTVGLCLAWFRRFRTCNSYAASWCSCSSIGKSAAMLSRWLRVRVPVSDRRQSWIARVLENHLQHGQDPTNAASPRPCGFKTTYGGSQKSSQLCDNDCDN